MCKAASFLAVAICWHGLEKAIIFALEMARWRQATLIIHTLTADSIFQFFSMTKPVTSFVFMQLVEQGLLRFEDKVKDYIPAFANPQVWVEGNTTDYTTALRRVISPCLI